MQYSSSPLPKFDHSVSVLCWAYNEEDLIEEFLRRITRLMNSAVEDYEIILIDDGSTDRTYERARKFQQENNRLMIYRNLQNMNVSFSFRKALEKASKEYIFWQTIDWSYDISNLRLYLGYLKEFDIVHGVRRRPVEVKNKLLKPIAALLQLFGMKHLTRRSDTIQKALISVVNYFLIRLLFRVPLSDFQNITLYPARWLKSIKFESNSSFTGPEILLKSNWKGMSIKEVEISFLPRNKGEAKGTRIMSIMNSVKDIFTLWFKWISLGRRGEIHKGIIHRLDPHDKQRKAENRDSDPV